MKPVGNLRRGVSLVELLIVISVSTIVIGVCVTTMHVLLRSERDQSRAVRTAVTLSRLSDIFRGDVHRFPNADVPSADEQSSRLTLTDADGRQIEYSANVHLVQRVEQARGAEVHRDTYYFPTGSKARFERDESPRLVRLVIDVAPATPDEMPERRARLAPPRTLVIEAVPGRDLRFARSKP